MTVAGSCQRGISASNRLLNQFGDLVNTRLLKKVTFAKTMSVKSTTSGFKVPVFVFPNEITFIANDPSSHKQVVTIYNPYDFHIQYRALCTARDKYTMPDWRGTLAPRRRIDIVIRCTEITDANIGVTDKFRFQIYDISSPNVTLVGEKEVPATLVATEESLQTEETASFRPSKKALLVRGDHSDLDHRRQEVDQGPSLFVIVLGLLCILALGLPDAGSPMEQGRLPSYLHLSLNQKLIAAYVLGLITMVLFRAR